MWIPDIRTIFLVQFFINGFLTLILYIYWKNEKTYPGFRTWMLSLPVMASASLFFFRPEEISPLLAILAANMLLLLALIMRFDSIWRFTRSGPYPRIIYFIAFPATILFLISSQYYAIPDSVRIPILTIIFLVIVIAGCIPLISHGEPGTYRIRMSIFFVIGIWIVLFIARLVWFLAFGQFSLYEMNVVNILYLFYSIVADILTTVFFILLNMARTRSELRTSEQQYKSLADNLPDYIIVHDAEHIHYANLALLRLTGRTLEEMQGTTLESVITHSGAEVVRQITEKPLSAATQEEPWEIDMITHNGTVRHCMMRTTGISSKRFSGFLSVITDITELKMAENALGQATKKLNLFTYITLTDIHSAIFTLSGYNELARGNTSDEKMQQILNRQNEVILTISRLLLFAKEYEGLGVRPPDWQNVKNSYLLGISHVGLITLARNIDVEGLEIYADPLLENVFTTLAENVAIHSRTATSISLYYQETTEGLTLVFEDNGAGIPLDMKEKIFERKTREKKGLGLFLVREILAITGITIRECGAPEKGARFEIAVPNGVYRFDKTAKIPVTDDTV